MKNLTAAGSNPSQTFAEYLIIHSPSLIHSSPAVALNASVVAFIGVQLH